MPRRPPSRGPHILTTLAALAATSAAQQAHEPPRHALRIEREVFLGRGERRVLEWSPDGKLLAMSGDCGEVIVVDAESGASVATLESPDDLVQALRFAPDGKSLAVAARDLALWTSDGRLLARAPLFEPKQPHWSRDGTTIACGLDAAHPVLFRAADLARVADDGTLLRRIRDDESAFGDAGQDRTRTLLKRECPTELLRKGHEPFRIPGRAPAALLPGSSLWARAPVDEIEVWDGDRKLRSFRASSRQVPERAFLVAGGAYLVAVDWIGARTVFDLATGTAVDVAGLPQGTPLPYGGGEELAMLATVGTPGDTEKRLQLWWLAPRGTGVAATLQRDVGLPEVRARRGRREVDARLDPSGRFCAAGRRVFDLLDARRPQVEDAESGTRDSLFPSPTGEAIAVSRLSDGCGGGSGTLRRIDRTGAMVAELRVDALPIAVDWSPDGGSLVLESAAGGRTCRVLDARLRPRLVLDRIWSTARWLDDDTLAVTTGESRSDPAAAVRRVALVSALTGATLASLDLEARPVPRSLEVDRRRKKLVVALGDRVVVVRCDAFVAR